MRRKHFDQVLPHQFVLGQIASVLAVDYPRVPCVRERAVRVANMIRLMKLDQEHRPDVLESFELMIAHIGGVKNDKLLSTGQRGEFYAALDALKKVDPPTPIGALTPAPEHEVTPINDMHTNAGNDAFDSGRPQAPAPVPPADVDQAVFAPPMPHEPAHQEPHAAE
ncbi:MAG: hypothetical protein JWM46_187 [Candidatus Kaiserbacteria bacterium]|nr:hypothetical protein [Candidatus Kaiserbacteria bacterium]